MVKIGESVNFYKSNLIFRLLVLLSLLPGLVAALPLGEVEVPGRGRYEIKNEIGRGAQGIVYLAEKMGKPGKFLVIKTFELNTGISPSKARELLREWQKKSRELNEKMRPMTSAKVLKYEDATLDIEGVQVQVLVSGYLEGQELAAILKAAETSAVGMLAMGTRFERDTGEALANLFSLGKDGIVHRDLKPSNFMLTPKGFVLLDHGIAKSGSERGPPKGTPAYMPPEYFREQGYAGDVWARAMILGQLLTGVHFLRDYVGPSASVQLYVNTLNTLAQSQFRFEEFLQNSVIRHLDRREEWWDSQKNSKGLAEFKRLRSIVEAGLSQSAAERVSRTIALKPRSKLARALALRTGKGAKPAGYCQRAYQSAMEPIIRALRNLHLSPVPR